MLQLIRPLQPAQSRMTLMSKKETWQSCTSRTALKIKWVLSY